MLEFNIKEKPLALQTGGSSPKILAEAAKIGEDFGYDEINLNLGCPSKKVQKNKFGACLMKEPNLVGECVNEMTNATILPSKRARRIPEKIEIFKVNKIQKKKLEEKNLPENSEISLEELKDQEKIEEDSIKTSDNN